MVEDTSLCSGENVFSAAESLKFSSTERTGQEYLRVRSYSERLVKD